MNDIKIASLDELKSRAKVDIETIALPELGEGIFVKVHGYTVGDVLDIQGACTFDRPDGTSKYDARNDRLLSVIKALEEPRLNLKDSEWILNLPDGTAHTIISAAMRLSRISLSAYEELKNQLRRNPYIRRIYSVCVEKLGRLPEELSDVPESEFAKVLAVLELDAEDEAKEIEKMQSEE